MNDFLYDDGKDKADAPNDKAKFGDKKTSFGQKKNKSANPASKDRKRKEFKPPKKISESYLYNSGLAYLQRYPASSMHFRSVMMRKINKSCRHHEDQEIEVCAQLLEELIVKFQDLALLDDSAYLKGMITSLRRRGLSSAQICNKLQQKGYQRDDVSEALKNFDRDEFDNEYEGDKHAALIFARKKRLGPFDVMNKRDPEKSLATMARAGYSYDIAKKTLEMDIDDLPDNMRGFIL